MKDHDRGDGEAVEYTEDLVAIGTAVDSELMLDYRYIELIKRRCRLRLRRRPTGDEVMNDIRSGGSLLACRPPERRRIGSRPQRAGREATR